MSALDRVRAKFKKPTQGTDRTARRASEVINLPIQATAKTDRRPFVGSVGASHRQINYYDDQLTPVQESARRELLALLDADPAVQRAFCNRFENGALIVTLAIRGIGTCELLIPAERFDARELKNFAALLECLGEARS